MQLRLQVSIYFRHIY